MNDESRNLDEAQHQRLCAYLFDEMAEAERVAFAAELAADPRLQAELAKLEQTASLVRSLGAASQGREAPQLAPERHERLVEAMPQPSHGGLRVALAAGLLAAVGGAAWWFGGGAGDQRIGDQRTGAQEPDTLAVVQRDRGTLDALGSGDVTRSESASSGEAAAAEAPRDEVAPTVNPVPVVDPAPVADAPTVATGARRAGQSESKFGALAGDTTALPSHSQGASVGMLSSGQAQAPAEAPVALYTEHLAREQAKQPGVGSQNRAFDSRAWNTSLGLGGSAGGGAVAPADPSLGLFFMSGQDGDLRARVENSFGVPVAVGNEWVVSDFDVETAQAAGIPVNLPSQWGDEHAGRYFFHVPSGTYRPFDPEQFFIFCRPRDNERPRDMFFRFWGDNAFVLTRGDKLATFGADVDTASYVLARRYLREGNLPQKAQIRTEEFVNYFDPDLAPPTTGDFAIHTELAPSRFGGSAARYLLRVGVRAREIPAEEREPLALTFVVDVSGSMKQNGRLELVKHAMLTLLSRLDGRDRIGIVAFSTEARLVLPMTSVTDAAQITAAVQSLSANGSTNAEGGLQLGYELAASGLDPESHSRVVFLSDGVANVGQTDQDRINQDVAERRQQGILLNTIGVGMGNHNDTFLEQLANKGDGVCDYVDDSRAVHRAIVERFTGAFQPVAADVKIQVEFDDGVVLRWRQLGYENRAIADQDFRNDAVDAGEVGSGHQVTALFELETAMVLSPTQASDINWATVRVRWLPPRRAGQEQEAREATELEHRVDASNLRVTFDQASPGYRRAALVAQFAECLRRSTHALGDSYSELFDQVQKLVREEAFAGDEDTAELVTLVQSASRLGLTTELQRSDLAAACDEYMRHRHLRHQLEQLERGLEAAELEGLRRQNDDLEERIRELARQH